ncbi:MAG: hypothetical protein K2N89_06655 [Lachnospiraceae bacterium]|nr:hypothetical protein [Lachnospiraceae bacterium]
MGINSNNLSVDGYALCISCRKKLLSTDWKFVQYVTDLYAQIVLNIGVRGIPMDRYIKNVL